MMRCSAVARGRLKAKKSGGVGAEDVVLLQLVEGLLAQRIAVGGSRVRRELAGVLEELHPVAAKGMQVPCR
jgi:hypothetical protein